MFVSDLSHFLGMPADAPAPARRMAEHLTRVVRGATAREGGLPWDSALPCIRRPGRRPCPGNIAVFRTDVPLSIEWACTTCEDCGIVSGWERSTFDLRPRNRLPASEGRPFSVAVSPETVATLRSILTLDPPCERLVFGAWFVCDDLMLEGHEDELESLVEAVAAEANHEPDSRRRRRFNAALDELGLALENLRPQQP